MKIKRIVAQDMRQAIRMVRETLGADAVILSNKSVPDGVELMAAVDLDPAALAAESEPAARASQPRRQAPAAGTGPESGAGVTPFERPAARPRRRAQAQPRGEAPARNAEPEQSGALEGMRREVAELRRLMHDQLCLLNWRDLEGRDPQTHALLRRLMELGLSADIARQLAARVGEGMEAEKAWRKALFLLAGELELFEEEILEQGGVIALVGPTGVGKTTTIAKLAARFALRHGHRQVALVTTDNFRIGDRDQLHTYGRILNVPVRNAAGAAELDDVIDALGERRLILIDTAGMGRDRERLEEQVATLGGCRHTVTTLLTLSATTDPSALEGAVRRFAAHRPDGCVLTKIDEAGTLGSAISAVIHSGLPLAFVADGQRVPEDLRIARAHPLVERAAELLEEQTPETDPAYLAFALGGAQPHAHA